MRANRLLTNTSWGLSFLLGQASVLLGLMLTLGWSFAFAVILEQKTGPRPLLPVGPPIIGLAMGVVGLVIAHRAHPAIAKYAIAGPGLQRPSARPGGPPDRDREGSLRRGAMIPGARSRTLHSTCAPACCGKV